MVIDDHAVCLQTTVDYNGGSISVCECHRTISVRSEYLVMGENFWYDEFWPLYGYDVGRRCMFADVSNYAVRILRLLL
jgi:hypothetical protein